MLHKLDIKNDTIQNDILFGKLILVVDFFILFLAYCCAAPIKLSTILFTERQAQGSQQNPMSLINLIRYLLLVTRKCHSQNTGYQRLLWGQCGLHLKGPWAPFCTFE